MTASQDSFNASSKPQRDAPEVLIFPPAILFVTLALGVALRWLVPLGLLVQVPLIPRLIAGAALFAAGVALAASGRRRLMRSGTNVNPMLPTTAIVTDGVYGWTRNPLYVGGNLALVGIALAAGSEWVLLLIIPAAALLHFGVVLPEERYLEAKFGDTYRRYKARAPRYFGPF
jgi:protein-S-isoprenylcysteine O-methyltransferase Ste14